jgi:hypothetical protein
MIRLTVRPAPRSGGRLIRPTIVFGDGERIERGARRVMGLAEYDAVGDGAKRRKGRDQDELGAPAERVVERAAEQRREAGRRRHRDHDQRHRACQCAAGKHVAGDRARQHRGGASARRLDDAADQEAGQVGRQRTPDAAGKEHGNPISTGQRRP